MKARVETKSEFSRMLGLVHPDHYIKTENDKEDHKPSLDLLEKAAEAAGFKLWDALRRPDTGNKQYPAKHQKLHDQLQAILELADGTDMRDYIVTGIHTVYKDYCLPRKKEQNRL